LHVSTQLLFGEDASVTQWLEEILALWVIWSEFIAYVRNMTRHMQPFIQ